VVAALTGIVGLVGAGAADPAGAATCATGTWRPIDATFSRTVKTPYGKVTVAPLPGGSIRLTVSAAKTWALTIDKSFRATGALPVGSVDGTARITGQGNGPYKLKKNGAVVFRLASGSGTAAFSGTVNGQPLAFSYPVKPGDVQKYLGIKGKAVPTCSPGRLTLRFKLITLTLVPA
jgi:hypothetical protein